MKKLLLSFLLLLLAASGFTQWSKNVQVNTAVATGGYNYRGANSISDEAGGVIIFYEDSFMPPGETEWLTQIFAQKLNANGIAQWGVGGKLITTVYGYVNKLVVNDGSGGAVLIYTAQVANGSGENKIYAQRLNANGDKQWGTSNLEITPTASDYGVDDAILDADGVVFTYEEEGDNDIVNSYAQKLNMSGALQWDANGVKLNDGTGEFEPAGIFKHGSGYVALIMQDYIDLVEDEDAGRLFLQKLNGNGTKNGTNILLQDYAPSGGYRYFPHDFTYDGNGGFYVGNVQESSSEVKLYLQHFLNDGTKTFNATTWGIAVDASMGKSIVGGMAYEVVLENDGANGVVLGWTDVRNTNYGLYAQRYNSAGIALWGGADLQIVENLGSGFYSSTIKRNTDGDFIFQIPKDVGGSSVHIYAQKVSLAGSLVFADGGVLIAGSNAYKYPEMIITNDKTIFVWDESRNGLGIYAQSVFNNGSLTGTFPVLNVNTTKGFNTIQNAINDATTQNGHEIQVAAGTYTENVTINKEITLKGSNAGVAPWNWSNSVTLINPPITNFTYANALITIAAHNVSIDGISFDGTNSNNPSPSPDGVWSRTINGKATHTGLGIVTGGGDIFNAPSIKNNKLENFTSRAIEIYSTGGKRSMEISNNQIDNVVAINTTSAAGIAYGISTSGFFGEIKNNRITRASTGIDMQFPFSFANDNVNTLNNTVEAYKTGMAFRGATAIAAPIITVEDNNITKADYNTWTAEGLNKTGINLGGFNFSGLAGDNSVSINNNNVSGANWGISTNLIQKSASNPNRFTISGGTLNNNYLAVDNYTAINNNYNARIVLSGVNITNSGFTAVRNFSTGGTYKSELVLKNGVQIINSAPATTYLSAITIEGINAELKELNDTKISGARTNFISITNSAMTGLMVDGKDVTYDGTVNGQIFSNYKPSATFDLTLRNAVKARINDGEDAGNTTAGIVTIPSTLPVSLVDFNATLKNNGALITWSTASELNNKHFIIEKSTDGVNFQALANIDGKGTTSVKSNYQFTDINFFQSAYYRLTQVDNNGEKTVYGNFIRYVKDLGEEDRITIYPNPTIEKINVKLPASLVSTTVKLIDVSGKVLQSKTTKSQILEFNLTGLPSGIYILQSQDDKGVFSQKVIKQ